MSSVCLKIGDDVFGLATSEERTKPLVPRKLEVASRSKAGDLCTIQLGEIFDRVFADEDFARHTIKRDGNSPFREAWLEFPRPKSDVPLVECVGLLPLPEVWRTWNAERGPETRDADGLELYRVGHYSDLPHAEAGRNYAAKKIAEWLVRIDPTPSPVDFLLDCVENYWATYGVKVICEGTYGRMFDNAAEEPYFRAKQHRFAHGDEWNIDQHRRYWGIQRWIATQHPENRLRPPLSCMVPSFRAGVASAADMYDYFLGPRSASSTFDFLSLGFLSGLGPVKGKYDDHFWFRRKVALYKAATSTDGLIDIVNTCRQRLVEAILSGSQDAETKYAALALEYTGGMDVTVAALRAIAQCGFRVSRVVYRDTALETCMSHVASHTSPGVTDTPAAFVRAIGEINVPLDDLIRLAFMAPQWREHVGLAVGCEGLSSAISFIEAHSLVCDDDYDEPLAEIRFSGLTTLTVRQLLDGECDTGWFRRTYGAVGPDMWARLDAAAKAVGSAQSTRPAMFAAAILGKASVTELERRALVKRSQDAARSLGLVPLPDESARDDEVARRYAILQEYIRGSKRFGAERRGNEAMAAQIGIGNLARNAGYDDVQRFEWAMELRAGAEQAGRSPEAVLDDLSVRLTVDAFGAPHVTAYRAGKALKAIPAQAKKSEAVAAILEQYDAVKKQGARVAGALENAMREQSLFEPSELVALLEHPVISFRVRNLLFADGRNVGYPIESGLSRLDDSVVPYGDSLRIAHPVDLLDDGQWAGWQRDCFLRERLQPFKQVFRELYVLNHAERATRSRSTRFDSMQVNARQGFGLFKSRGWLAHMFADEATKTFAGADIQAVATIDRSHMSFGLPTDSFTLRHVCFARRGRTSEEIPLVDVPPILFSETMRDLDLVVSVGHAADIETSEETILTRAALVREMANKLDLENVAVRGRIATVVGQRATYTVHLGSSVVHVLPGGQVCSFDVPPMKERVYLPSGEGDPQSTLVLSKVLFLAWDDEISDPAILAQLSRFAR
jgi:hypothetical protein